MLSWGYGTFMEDGRALSDLMQGVTLEIFGEGRSPGPYYEDGKLICFISLSFYMFVKRHPKKTGELIKASLVLGCIISGVSEKKIKIIKDYGEAAQRIKEAGLDGVEIEAYGHLLDSFWSPATNKRRDKFGGSIENRISFSMKVSVNFFTILFLLFSKNKNLSLSVSL